MPVCSECRMEFAEEDLFRCGECGRAYCDKCAEANGTIKDLGVCSDCEETYEAEEDYWDWM